MLAGFATPSGEFGFKLYGPADVCFFLLYGLGLKIGVVVLASVSLIKRTIGHDSARIASLGDAWPPDVGLSRPSLDSNFNLRTNWKDEIWIFCQVVLFFFGDG